MENQGFPLTVLYSKCFTGCCSHHTALLLPRRSPMRCLAGLDPLLLVPCGHARTLNPCPSDGILGTHGVEACCASRCGECGGRGCRDRGEGCCARDASVCCAVNPTMPCLAIGLHRKCAAVEEFLKDAALHESTAREGGDIDALALATWRGATAQSVSTGARGLHLRQISTPYAAYLVPPYRVHVHLKTGFEPRLDPHTCTSLSVGM